MSNLDELRMREKALAAELGSVREMIRDLEEQEFFASLPGLVPGALVTDKRGRVGRFLGLRRSWGHYDFRINARLKSGTFSDKETLLYWYDKPRLLEKRMEENDDE